LLRIFDLANRGSILAIQTEDRAVAATDDEMPAPPTRSGARPFRLLGRLEGSEGRGCSLDVEEARA
jgi:hypothetical protein